MPTKPKLEVVTDPQHDAATPRLRFRDAAPEWARLTEKLTELTAREATLIEELRPLNERMARKGEFSTGVVRRTVKSQDRPAPIEHSDAVKKLLGDLTPPPAAPHEYKIVENHDKAQWRLLSEELDTVRTAIGLIHEPLKKAWLDGSAAYCQHVGPDYRTIASGLCASLIALGQAVVAHEDFAKDLREQGVAWGMLRPMSIAALGSPLKPDSEFTRVLKWAIECGHLHTNDIPTEWSAHRGSN